MDLVSRLLLSGQIARRVISCCSLGDLGSQQCLLVWRWGADAVDGCIDAMGFEAHMHRPRRDPHGAGHSAYIAAILLERLYHHFAFSLSRNPAAQLVCITHCIATPFLAAALPVLAVTETETHIGLAVVLFVIGLLAFLPGYRLHSKPYMALVAALGFVMLLMAAFLPETLSSEELETGLTVAGGLLLVTAHLSNAYYCRRCRICAEDPCS